MPRDTSSAKLVILTTLTPLFVSTALLLACGSKSGEGAASSSGAGSATTAPSAARSAAPPGHASLEVVRMADDVDVFGHATNLPPGGSLLSETVPNGSQKRLVPKDMAEDICQKTACEKLGNDLVAELPLGVTHDFLRVVPLEGEGLEAARQRLITFAGKRDVPEGSRVVVGKFLENDPDTKKNVAVGFRSYVVAGEPAITEKDIQTAAADTSKNPPMVTVQLGADGAQRFETFTEKSRYHRVAILVDGEILAAPLVESKISGGKLAIAIGTGDNSPAEKEEAERIAHGLTR